LSKMAGKRGEAVDHNAFEGDVQYRQAFPLESCGLRWDRNRGFERSGRGRGGYGGRWSAGHWKVGRLLAPGGDCRAQKSRT
jgi:hypothetical protein